MPEITCLTLGPLATNCWLLTHDRRMLVVDPGAMDPRLEEAIAGFEISAVVLTHGHADHIGGVPLFRDRGIPLLIGAADAGMLHDPAKNLSLFVGPPFSIAGGADRLLQEGDSISLGDETLLVRTLPGHSPGGIGLFAPGFVVCGDVLFQESVGRTDLPGGDFDALEAAIREKLYTLDPLTRVLPGHGPETTIGAERRHNPFVRPLPGR